MISTDLTVWIAAILTLFTFSFLIKSTLLYKIAEYTSIGVAMGNSILMAWNSLYSSGIYPISQGQLFIIPPLVVGLLLFTTLGRKYAYAARYPMSWMVAVGVGLAMRTIPQSAILLNIIGNISPFTKSLTSVDFFNNVLVIVIFLFVLSYFLFTIKTNKVLDNSFKVGRFLIMATFGATYGGHIGTRLTFIIDRVQYILITWLGLK